MLKKTICAVSILFFSLAVLAGPICDEIQVGDADMKYFQQWKNASNQRPECAKPVMMMAMSLINDVDPMMMLYMPDAPRVCLEDDPEIRENLKRNRQAANHFADLALDIEPSYLRAWQIKLRVHQSAPDFQPTLPKCRNAYPGNGELFVRTVRDGLKVIADANERLEFIQSFLRPTLVPGFFRDDNGKFSDATSPTPRFLSATQEKTLRQLAIKELTALLPALSDKEKMQAEGYIKYLRKG